MASSSTKPPPPDSSAPDTLSPLPSRNPSIPVISLASPPPTIIAQIRQAFETYGFFELRDHSFPESLQSSILRASVDFFNLPLEKKLETLKRDAVHTGYESYRSHNLGKDSGKGGNRWGGSTVHEHGAVFKADEDVKPVEDTSTKEEDVVEEQPQPQQHSEEKVTETEVEIEEEEPDQNESFAVSPTFVDTRPGSLSRWPHGHDLPGFEQLCRMYYNAAEKLSRQLGTYIAAGLGLREDAFEDFFCGQVAHMRLIHYYASSERRSSMGSPASNGSSKRASMDAGRRASVNGAIGGSGDAGKNDGGMGAGLHSDWGLITVLLQDDVGGLEVLDEKTGEFIPVPPSPSSLIVNCGDLLELMTNKHYSAVRHRMLSPPPGRDRYSVAFFNEGNPEFEVDVLPGMLKEGEKKRTRRMSVGRYIVSRFEESNGDGGGDGLDGVGY